MIVVSQGKDIDSPMHSPYIYCAFCSCCWLTVMHIMSLMTFHCLFTQQTGEQLTCWLLLLLYITANFHPSSPTPVCCFSARLDSISSGNVETTAPGDWTKCSFSSLSLQHLVLFCNCGKPKTAIYEMFGSLPLATHAHTHTGASAAVECRTVCSGPCGFIRAARTKITHWSTSLCPGHTH